MLCSSSTVNGTRTADYVSVNGPEGTEFLSVSPDGSISVTLWWVCSGCILGHSHDVCIAQAEPGWSPIRARMLRVGKSLLTTDGAVEEAAL